MVSWFGFYWGLDFIGIGGEGGLGVRIVSGGLKQNGVRMGLKPMTEGLKG